MSKPNYNIQYRTVYNTLYGTIGEPYFRTTPLWGTLESAQNYVIFEVCEYSKLVDDEVTITDLESGAIVWRLSESDENAEYNDSDYTLGDSIRTEDANVAEIHRRSEISVEYHEYL